MTSLWGSESKTGSVESAFSAVIVMEKKATNVYLQIQALNLFYQAMSLNQFLLQILEKCFMNPNRFANPSFETTKLYFHQYTAFIILFKHLHM